tara:strand:+ start:2089 stop:2973 length:885 start_codon:yes stop_codon:yes gene_type:complete
MSRNKGRVSPSEEDVLEQEEPPPVTPVTYPTQPPPDSSGFNWTNPTYFVDLPSKGMFYPPTHPLFNKDTVEIKYMTAKEEDFLTSQPLLRKGIAIDRVIESVLIDKDIELDSLLLGDKNAIMVGTRITGYGEEYKAKVTCPKCKEDTDFEFNLEKIENWDFEAKLEELGCEFTPKNTVMVKLPLTGVDVEIRLLNGHDDKRLTEKANKKNKKNLESSLLTDQLRAFIVSVNGIDSPFAIANFVTEMPARDSKFLRDLYLNIAPNIDLTQEYQCSRCGYEADMEVPLGVNFFWPE